MYTAILPSGFALKEALHMSKLYAGTLAGTPGGNCPGGAFKKLSGVGLVLSASSDAAGVGDGEVIGVASRFGFVEERPQCASDVKGPAAQSVTFIAASPTASALACAAATLELISPRVFDHSEEDFETADACETDTDESNDFNDSDAFFLSFFLFAFKPC